MTQQKIPSIAELLRQSDRSNDGRQAYMPLSFKKTDLPDSKALILSNEIESVDKGLKQLPGLYFPTVRAECPDSDLIDAIISSTEMKHELFPDIASNAVHALCIIFSKFPESRDYLLEHNFVELILKNSDSANVLNDITVHDLMVIDQRLIAIFMENKLLEKAVQILINPKADSKSFLPCYNILMFFIQNDCFNDKEILLTIAQEFLSYIAFPDEFKRMYSLLFFDALYETLQPFIYENSIIPYLIQNCDDYSCNTRSAALSLFLTVSTHDGKYLMDNGYLNLVQLVFSRTECDEIYSSIVIETLANIGKVDLAFAKNIVGANIVYDFIHALIEGALEIKKSCVKFVHSIIQYLDDPDIIEFIDSAQAIKNVVQLLDADIRDVFILIVEIVFLVLDKYVKGSLHRKLISEVKECLFSDSFVDSLQQIIHQDSNDEESARLIEISQAIYNMITEKPEDE